LSAECSRFDNDLLVFLEMHVQRRAVRSCRQGAFGDDENDLSLGIAHAAHPQDLSSTAVFQVQEVIHDSILICDLCTPKTTSYESYHWASANWQQPFAEVIWQSWFTRKQEPGRDGGPWGSKFPLADELDGMRGGTSRSWV
jgi:hypothetical protein